MGFNLNRISMPFGGLLRGLGLKDGSVPEDLCVKPVDPMVDVLANSHGDVWYSFKDLPGGQVTNIVELIGSRGVMKAVPFVPNPGAGSLGSQFITSVIDLSVDIDVSASDFFVNFILFSENPLFAANPTDPGLRLRTLFCTAAQTNRGWRSQGASDITGSVGGFLSGGQPVGVDPVLPVARFTIPPPPACLMIQWSNEADQVLSLQMLGSTFPQGQKPW
jgi:hypothetical protein